MDGSPSEFLHELRHALLRKRIGQIALAVLIAQEILRFIASIVWNLFLPLIGRFLAGQTESVLFERSTRNPIPWDALAGAVIELAFTVIVVFYLNRWIHKRPVFAVLPPHEAAIHEGNQTAVGQDVD